MSDFLLELHHVNVPALSLERMARFYTHVLGLQPFVPERADPSVEFGTRFLEGAAGQVHLTPPNPTLLFGNGMPVNPLLRGHLAFRAPDIDRMKDQLRRTNTPFADYGEWAIRGWHQLFLFDPEGNVIEVHAAR